MKSQIFTANSNEIKSALKNTGWPVVMNEKIGIAKARKIAFPVLRESKYPVKSAMRMGSIKYSGKGNRCAMEGKAKRLRKMAKSISRCR